MAHGASFSQRFMLVNEKSCLVLMALGAYRILGRKRPDSIRFNSVFSVRIVAIRATHLAFGDRMVVLQAERSFFIQMTLITGLRILPGINYSRVFLGLCLGIGMKAARTVTSLARLAFFTFGGHDYARVFGSLKIFRYLFMAHGAGIHAHICCAGDLTRLLHSVAF